MTVTVTGEGISPLDSAGSKSPASLTRIDSRVIDCLLFQRAPLSLRLMMPLTIFHLRRPISIYRRRPTRPTEKKDNLPPLLSPCFNLFSIVLIYARLRHSRRSQICISLSDDKMLALRRGWKERVVDTSSLLKNTCSYGTSLYYSWKR